MLVKNPQARRSHSEPSVANCNLYGFRICSCYPLAFECADKAFFGSITFTIETKEFFDNLKRRENLAANADWFFYQVLNDDAIYVSWRNLFEFLITDRGRSVASRCLADATSESFHTYLLGQILSFAVLEQGMEPLHGSAVEVEGRAIAFLGDCGYGKSTLAAAFVKAGYPLLTDDLIVLKKEFENCYHVLPGASRIKLFSPDSRNTDGTMEDCVPLNPHTKKMIVPLSKKDYCSKARQLDALYILNDPSCRPHPQEITISRLAKRSAFIAICNNLFNSVVTKRSRQANLLNRASELVNDVKINSLSYPRNTKLLNEVLEKVLGETIG